MKIIRNTGAERVIDIIQPEIQNSAQLDVVTPSLSLFAFAEVREQLAAVAKTRLVLPPAGDDLGLCGAEGDRPARNRLQTHWLARRCAEWVEQKVEPRRASGPVPQGALVFRNEEAAPQKVILGSFSLTTPGLGITPGNPLSLIQTSETPEEAALLSQWFDTQWASLAADPDAERALLETLRGLASSHAPFTIYTLILNHLFRDRHEALDEERIVKSATGGPFWGRTEVSS